MVMWNLEYLHSRYHSKYFDSEIYLDFHLLLLAPRRDTDFAMISAHQRDKIR